MLILQNIFQNYKNNKSVFLLQQINNNSSKKISLRVRPFKRTLGLRPYRFFKTSSFGLYHLMFVL